MKRRIIDSHIHLDLYSEKEREQILAELEKNGVDTLISVSNHLQSARTNWQLAQEDNRIKPAFGFHPEQPLPADNKITDLQQFIDAHREDMVAIGEVGLPYYLRKD